jgi:HK97 family phage major capsid protein
LDIKDLREKRAKLIADARAIYAKAEEEKRAVLNAEEEPRYTALLDEAGTFGTGMGDDGASRSTGLALTIENLERLEDEERRLREPAGDPAPRPDPAEGGDPPETRNNPRATKEYRAAFQRFLRSGNAALSAEEHRSLQADSDEPGGYTVAPVQFVTDLLKAVDDQVFIRQLATKNPVANAASLGIVSLDADPADADWTTELGTGEEDTAMDFGKRELHPHPLAKRIKVSNKLLRVSSQNIEQLVRDRLAYKFGITQEKAFQTGSGANQPLGVFTASAQGISTGRDVVCGSTTAITADGLLDMKYALKGAYHVRARWLFHRDGVKGVAKLKTTDNQYIWQPGLQAGQPDRLLNLPLMMSEYTPNTFTTGLYVSMLGDFAFYNIADALDMQVQRLVELYAEANQVGFIGRLETDGMPVLEEAFVRGKLA